MTRLQSVRQPRSFAAALCWKCCHGNTKQPERLIAGERGWNADVPGHRNHQDRPDFVGFFLCVNSLFSREVLNAVSFVELLLWIVSDHFDASICVCLSRQVSQSVSLGIGYFPSSLYSLLVAWTTRPSTRETGLGCLSSVSRTCGREPTWHIKLSPPARLSAVQSRESLCSLPALPPFMCRS
jgi:hypothetical protein